MSHDAFPLIRSATPPTLSPERLPESAVKLAVALPESAGAGAGAGSSSGSGSGSGSGADSGAGCFSKRAAAAVDSAWPNRSPRTKYYAWRGSGCLGVCVLTSPFAIFFGDHGCRPGVSVGKARNLGLPDPLSRTLVLVCALRLGVCVLTSPFAKKTTCPCSSRRSFSLSRCTPTWAMRGGSGCAASA